MAAERPAFFIRYNDVGMNKRPAILERNIPDEAADLKLALILFDLILALFRKENPHCRSGQGADARDLSQADFFTARQALQFLEKVGVRLEPPDNDVFDLDRAHLKSSLSQKISQGKVSNEKSDIRLLGLFNELSHTHAGVHIIDHLFFRFFFCHAQVSHGKGPSRCLAIVIPNL